MSTFITQAGFERLIRHYLHDKGFTETERAFVRQAGLAEDEAGATMALSHRIETERGMLDDLTAHWATSNDPAVLFGAYNRFAAWADNSLDLYRGELLRMLWPIFVHCYLELVSRDAAALASALLSRYRRRLIDMAGKLSHLRSQELAELQGVVMKQHLESSQLARKVLNSKQTVRLSSYAHELLMNYLYGGASTLPILGIVNRYVNFEVKDGLPQTVATDETGAAEDQGEWDVALPEGELHSTNQQPVQLGLLEGNVEDVFADEEEQQQEAAAAAVAAAASAAAAVAATAAAATADGVAVSVGDQPGELTAAAKKPKKAEAKEAKAAAAAAAAAKARKEAEQAERVEAKPFVPTLKEPVKLEWLEHIRHRAKVSCAILPSCCLFTFVNTRQALNCVALHRDGAEVAGGFADSTIRVTCLRHSPATDAKQSGRQSVTPPPSGPTGMNIDGEENEYSSDDDDGGDDNDGANGAQSGGQPPSTSYRLVGHTAPLHALEYSHDHQLLLSGSADGTVRSWSTALRAPLAVYRGHLFPVWSVSACPLGPLFATSGADKTARVWSMESTSCLRLCAGHQADVDIVRWHPNCHYIATASGDRTVRLWDVQTGACVRFLAGQPTSPTALAFTPNGRALTCGGADGSVVVWDLGTARRVATLPAAHSGPVWSLAYSHGGGAVLASGGADETVRLWSTEVVEGSEGGPAYGRAAPAPVAAGAAAGRQQLYTPLKTFRTKSSPVVALQFSSRNLLLGAGAFTMRSRQV